MSLLEVSPVIRDEFLKLCGYKSGKTCRYQGHMEASYSSPKLADVRPDGLLICNRGKSDWAAFVEAKAGKSPIRPEQIVDYLELASVLGVGTLITISNEFARIPTELPYHIAAAKRRKANIFHFAWSDIRTFLSLQLSNSQLHEIETKVLDECLKFFWEPTSGIQTYDSMPQAWPKFVEASGTSLGFGTNTHGITEILHGWVQERRDLCSKLVHELHEEVELGHQAGLRADAELRLKTDKKKLADDYQLSAHYNFKRTKAKLRILAELRLRKTSLALEIQPPAGKKAKAVVNWFVSIASEIDLSDAKISFDWKGRNQDITMEFEELMADPEIAYTGQKDAPKGIRIIRALHDVRRFKSAKKFIEGVEYLALSTVQEAKKAGWI